MCLSGTEKLRLIFSLVKIIKSRNLTDHWDSNKIIISCRRSRHLPTLIISQQIEPFGTFKWRGDVP